jgi:hypothetical protein
MQRDLTYDLIVVYDRDSLEWRRFFRSELQMPDDPALFTVGFNGRHQASTTTNLGRALSLQIHERRRPCTCSEHDAVREVARPIFCKYTNAGCAVVRKEGLLEDARSETANK